MTRFICLMCIAAVLVLLAAPAATEGDDKVEVPATRPSDTAATQPRPKLRGEYALMAAEAGLTDKQKVQLAATVMEGRDAEVRMLAANKERLDNLQKDLAEARRADNKDEISSILQQIMRINAAATKAKKALDESVMGLLTPEQKAKWAGFVLYRSVCRTLSRAELTDDQKTAVRRLCDNAALELGDDALKTSRKRVVAEKKLRDTVKSEILTDQQRKALGIRLTKPRGTRPVRPARPAKPPKKPVRQPPTKRR